MYDEADLRGGAAGSRRGRVAGLAVRIALDANLVAIAALVDLVRDVGEDKQRARRRPVCDDRGEKLFFQLTTSPSVSGTLQSILTAFFAPDFGPEPLSGA